MPRKANITNWGLYPVVETDFEVQNDVLSVADMVRESNSLIARGNGRCYGDSALNNNNILSSIKLDKILFFDEATGEIECQSGVLFSDLLEVIVPRGWFLPVTPGTKFITVGGAIASDVHGKNHHVEGNFSNHLSTFKIVLPDGEVKTCSESENSDLFWASCGGMGLTGIIVSAKFRLKKIETAYISQLSIKSKNIDEAFDNFEKYKDYTYSVAWIDCLAKGNKLGRSLLMVGEHSSVDELPAKYKKQPLKPHDPPKFNMPIHLPSFVLNPLSIKAFNFLYYNKQLAKLKNAIIHYEPFYYPLDSIYNWNRMYGKNGFTQYQFVLPLETSREGLVEILNGINKSGEGSFLAVLKLFGKHNPQEFLSFPFEGYTLALDFKISPKVFALLDRLDELVLKHKGRVYLTKDVRMPKQMFDQTYPRAGAFKEVIKSLNSGSKFSSLQSERIGLTTV